MSHIQLHSAESFSQKLGFAEDLDLQLEESKPTRWGVARLIRREVRRRGLVTRRDLRKTIEPYFQAARFEQDAGLVIRDVADEMVELGEIADLKVESQRGYAALASRWIRLGGNVAVLLGTIATEKHRFHTYHPLQFLRRFRINADIVSGLEKAGVFEQQFEEWFGEPDWRRFCVKGENLESLDALLSVYIESLEDEGASFSLDNTSILALKMEPGEFFGQPWGDSRCRWAAPKSLPEGIYIGAQQGFAERQWHPLFLKISAEECRSQFINHNNSAIDSIELRNWLLIALAKRNGNCEKIFVDHEKSEIQFTCPLPSQIVRGCKLAGELSGSWRFNILNSRALVEKLKAAVPFLDFVGKVL